MCQLTKADKDLLGSILDSKIYELESKIITTNEAISFTKDEASKTQLTKQKEITSKICLTYHRLREKLY